MHSCQNDPPSVYLLYAWHCYVFLFIFLLWLSVDFVYLNITPAADTLWTNDMVSFIRLTQLIIFSCNRKLLLNRSNACIDTIDWIGNLLFRIVWFFFQVSLAHPRTSNLSFLSILCNCISERIVIVIAFQLDKNDVESHVTPFKHSICGSSIFFLFIAINFIADLSITTSLYLNRHRCFLISIIEGSKSSLPPKKQNFMHDFNSIMPMFIYPIYLIFIYVWSSRIFPTNFYLALTITIA